MPKLPPLLGRSTFPDPFGSAPEHLPLVPIPLTPSLTALCLPAGVQSREKPPEESSVPARRRTPSDSHYEKSSPEPSSPRSPTVLSPEVVSTIAANPGGRPKEVRTGRLAGRGGCLRGGGRLGDGSGTWGILSIIGDERCFLDSWEEVEAFLLGGGILEVCAHRMDGANPSPCSPPQPHLHSYKEAFEELDGASPSSPTSGGGEISPPTPAFPVSPQTPYSDPRKCRGSGRLRGLVGGSCPAKNSPRVRQLRAPHTHRHENHSSSPSSFLLHIPPLHAAFCIPRSPPSSWLFPILLSLGCFSKRDQGAG